mmetsp:Transcript_5346/g.19555  ORF Transcript_5346/g.19555 Transcript_5346/m.19555 type:complete len:302 (+) Transcript_5346:185-1090(+)
MPSMSTTMRLPVAMASSGLRTSTSAKTVPNSTSSLSMKRYPVATGQHSTAPHAPRLTLARLSLSCMLPAALRTCVACGDLHGDDARHGGVPLPVALERGVQRAVGPQLVAGHDRVDKRGGHEEVHRLRLEVRLPLPRHVRPNIPRHDVDVGQEVAERVAEAHEQIVHAIAPPHDEHRREDDLRVGVEEARGRHRQHHHLEDERRPLRRGAEHQAPRRRVGWRDGLAARQVREGQQQQPPVGARVICARGRSSGKHTRPHPQGASGAHGRESCGRAQRSSRHSQERARASTPPSRRHARGSG